MKGKLSRGELRALIDELDRLAARSRNGGWASARDEKLAKHPAYFRAHDHLEQEEVLVYGSADWIGEYEPGDQMLPDGEFVFDGEKVLITAVVIRKDSRLEEDLSLRFQVLLNDTLYVVRYGRVRMTLP